MCQHAGWVYQVRFIEGITSWLLVSLKLFCRSTMSKQVATENPEYSSSANLYDTTNDYRGLALVFNHENFETEKKRDGTNEDRDNLKDLLSSLKFDVHIYDDLDKKEVLKTLKIWSEEKYSDCDCLVVVVMTHGDPHNLYAKDSCYPVESLWVNFIGNRCPSLIGKPKMFFIQACRGKALDQGVVFDPERQNDKKDCKTYEGSNSSPPMADLLVMYSTYEGHCSWRNPKNGGVFIQTLCSELKANGNKRELLTLLTGVSRRTAYEFQSYVPDDEKYNAKKQMPCLVSTLTKSFYFTDKTTSKKFELKKF